MLLQYIKIWTFLAKSTLISPTRQERCELGAGSTSAASGICVYCRAAKLGADPVDVILKIENRIRLFSFILCMVYIARVLLTHTGPRIINKQELMAMLFCAGAIRTTSNLSFAMTFKIICLLHFIHPSHYASKRIQR